MSLVDLYPTFLDVAGAVLPEPLYSHGHSLGPLLTGEPETVKAVNSALESGHSSASARTCSSAAARARRQHLEGEDEATGRGR